MKIWSESLTVADLFECAVEVNSDFPGCDVYLGGDGPSLHENLVRRIDKVHLRAKTGRRFPNSGQYGALHEGELAASWTEWGWFLARVFMRDANARCGDYRGIDDFNAQTNDRFIEPRSPRERQIKRELRRAS